MADTAPPKVIACLAQNLYTDFLAPHVDAAAWGFELLRCEPARGVDYLNGELRQSGAQVLMTCWGTPKLPDDLLKQAPTLRYVCHLCGEMRHLVPRGLIKQGLLVSNWGDSIARVVAEHCLLQILACLRRVTASQLQLHTAGKWDLPDEPQRSLFGRTIGMHGFGAIAQQLTWLLLPFDCSIMAYSPSVPDEIFKRYRVTRCASLEALFSRNQIVVELAPLTPRNRGIVNEPLLRAIQPGGIFVNSGRGAVVDERALERVAQEGRVQFALDVFETEPLPVTSPLRGLPNVFLTPHIGGPTPDRRRDCGLYALQNVQAFFKGAQLRSQIGLEQYDRMT